MIKKIIKIVGLGLLGYSFLLGLIYFNQERLIFLPSKLEKDYIFKFDADFDEINLHSRDSLVLNSLYFYAKKSKGVVYYLHGNSGNLSGWGDISQAYLDLGYDVFIIDYRGFGKSEGKIQTEKQFYEDAQVGYDFLTTKFPEKQIIIIGYSIGTGAASFLASKNSPKLLVLQAPYYNLSELASERFPFVPTALLKYRFENNQNLHDVNCPIAIFHGDKDNIIPYDKAKKLKILLDENDRYITLKGQNHNGINKNVVYLKELKSLLYQ